MLFLSPISETIFFVFGVIIKTYLHEGTTQKNIKYKASGVITINAILKMNAINFITNTNIRSVFMPISLYITISQFQFLTLSPKKFLLDFASSCVY
jgi:hypothetical protein